MKIYIYIASILTFMLFLGGCKNFLDINTDPNNALDAEVQFILPSAEAGLTYALGNDLQIKGGIWSQYWTQNPNSSQYKSLDQYSPAASDFDATWLNINSDALEDFQKIIEKGGATKKKQYVAVASLLKAYTFQLSTDLFGDIPYTEALKGDNNILTPKFDKQQVIYDSLINLVEYATKLIDPSDLHPPGADDLIYKGDMMKWKRFANTLKLKIALRLSEVDPIKAAKVISSLQGADFIRSGESAQVNYTSTGGNQNPLYSAIAGPVLNHTQNLVASSTAIDFFNNYNDPRVLGFYTGFTGISQGSYATTPSAGSIPSTRVGGNANSDSVNSALAPVKIITDYESKFLQAEAIARGWLTGDDKSLYNSGIIDNYISYLVDTTDIATYYNQPDIIYPSAGSLDEKLSVIITQKWAAMCGNQSIEAWIEWRRTGYPSFFVFSPASIIGSGRMPTIFLYPSIESTRNSNTPAQHKIYDRVWWDTK